MTFFIFFLVLLSLLCDARLFIKWMYRWNQSFLSSFFRFFLFSIREAGKRWPDDHLLILLCKFYQRAMRVDCECWLMLILYIMLAQRQI